MKKSINPAALSGSVTAPPSKSAAQRALLLSTLLSSASIVRVLEQNESHLCDDIRRCAQAIRSLGASVEFRAGQYHVTPGAELLQREVNCGESGTCFRMICALCATFEHEFEIVGEGSLATRPMEMGVAPLQDLGVKVSTNQGKLPMLVKGPVRAGQALVDGATSSQFLSGLLLALPFSHGQFVLQVKNLKSKPYVQLTLEMLKRVGVEIHYSADFRYFQIQGEQSASGSTLNIEGDWSSIATLLIAGAVAGTVEVTHADPNSVQADKAVLEALEAAGASVTWNDHSVTVTRPNVLKAFRFDAEDCPDLIPVLTALAVNCQGQSEILGADRLTHKESDRASALCSEYGKLGAAVTKKGNSMLVTGSSLQSGIVSSHSDHRIAMSLAIAALRANGVVEIEDAQAVTKSYPAFFRDLEKLANNSTP